MNRPALLVFVRHAQSERNMVKGKNIYFPDEATRQTVEDVPDQLIKLTPQGIIQAEQTGPSIRDGFGTFDYVYHSGFKRTIETMEGILKAYPAEEKAKMNIRMNPFIYERHSGHAYNMTTKEADTAFPWLQGYWKTFGGFFAQPPGGESLAQVTERVYLFINMLFRDRAGEKILVITHGGTLRCIRFILEHWTFDQAKAWPKGQSPKNCGVTSYEFDKTTQRLELRKYNQVFWK